MIPVELHPYELAVCDTIANLRHTDNHGTQFAGYPDRNGKRLLMNRVAARAECAVAKHYDRYWSGMAKMQPDVGFRWEVRAIDDRAHGLIVRSKDSNVPHLLGYADLDSPVVEILGWALPDDVRVDRYFRNGSPQDSSAFWLVPNAELHEVEG